MAFEKLEPARDSSEKTTVFLHSTHEALEMDMAKLFAEGGLKVTGIFCGEPIQRPKLRWIARAGLEPKSPERSRVERMAATKADIGERAVYVAMNNSDLVRRCRFFADLGIPVVAHLVGQTDDEKLASLAATMRSSSLVWAVSYSLKERDALARFLSGSTAIERLRIIRFGMDRGSTTGGQESWNLSSPSVTATENEKRPALGTLTSRSSKGCRRLWPVTRPRTSEGSES